MRTHLLLAASTLFAACAAQPPSIASGKPAYLAAATADVPNEAAITQRIWMPGLEEGWVPQGLTVLDGHVFVSAYRSADPKVNTGPCRVYRIDPKASAAVGHFDMPPALCSHSGGLAALGSGMLMLSDTRQLFRIDVARALASGKAEDGLRGSVKLGGLLRGSFAAFDGRDPWIGTWTKEAGQGRMFRLPASLFDEHDGKTVQEAVALESIPIPLEVQGAAFDREGRVWLTASNSRWGKLYRLDRRGAVEGEWPAVPGIEDIEFDASGGLWAVSESGTRKYMHWATHFPFVFRMDVGRLR